MLRQYVNGKSTVWLLIASLALLSGCAGCPAPGPEGAIVGKWEAVAVTSTHFGDVPLQRSAYYNTTFEFRRDGRVIMSFPVQTIMRDYEIIDAGRMAIVCVVDNSPTIHNFSITNRELILTLYGDTITFRRVR